MAAPSRSVIGIGLMPKEPRRRSAHRSMPCSTLPRLVRRILSSMTWCASLITGPISRLMAAGEEDMSKYLLEDKLASFQMPVDLIWGASDRLVPLDYAKKLQSQLPHCTLTVIERCGHAPQLERPRELTRVLLQILASDSSRRARHCDICSSAVPERTLDHRRYSWRTRPS